MTAPKITQSPSNWHTHDTEPDTWYNSAKQELERIEHEEGRKA